MGPSAYYAEHQNGLVHQCSAYERYMNLHSQQADLRRRLSVQLPSSLPSPSRSPECSPTRAQPFAFATPSSPTSAYPSTMSSSETSFSSCEAAGHSCVDDRKALYGVNQQIKLALTELLNKDDVKRDSQFRSFVQARLMDAEMEMKRQRRRRSSDDSNGVHSEEEMMMCKNIARHITHSPE